MVGRPTRMALSGLLLLTMGWMAGCGFLQAATGPPLPPAETLSLEARLVPGDEALGNRTVRLSWAPPRGGVGSVFLEQASGPEGPWEEVKVVDAARGFHEETTLYRPGRFYYFRVSLIRGREESSPSPTVELWVPFAGPATTPTPAPTRTPTPTPSPVPPA